MYMYIFTWTLLVIAVFKRILTEIFLGGDMGFENASLSINWYIAIKFTLFFSEELL